MIEDFERESGWTAIYRTGHGRARTCLLVAPGRTINDYGWADLSPRTDVGSWGAGPSTIGRKRICWAIIDGRLLASVHFVASVQRPALTARQREQRNERRDLWTDQARAVVEWIDGRDAVVLGDLNATKGYGGFATFREAGINSHTRASKGARGIDYVQNHGDVRVTEVTALPGYLSLSDHRPVAGTVAH